MKGGHLADRLSAMMKRPVALVASGAASVGVEVIPTGVLSLNMALGVGGWPCGRVIEIFGDEAVGKTTLAMAGLIEAQKLGFETCYVDVEQAVDFTYAQNMGVDLDQLAIAQPKSGEEALEIAMFACQAGARYIVVDSVAALVPKSEVDGGMLKQSMGAQARLMSQALRSLIGAAKTANACLIFINQTRSKVGVVYGSPRTTTGGAALRFYSSIRVDLRSNGKVEATGKEQVGVKVRGIVAKNKLANPLQLATWDIVWGQGIDRGVDLLTAGLENGVLTKRGSHIYFGANRIAASAAKAADALREDTEIGAAIEAATMAGLAQRDGRRFESFDTEVDPESVDLSEPDELEGEA